MILEHRVLIDILKSLISAMTILLPSTYNIDLKEKYLQS